MIGAGLILDGIISLLLVTTIIYCWKLGRKITQLKQGKKELAEFLLEFSDSIKKAESNISELKELGSRTDEVLCEHIKKARFLANDLSFLMGKGENVAEALEHFIEAARPTRRNLLRDDRPFPAAVPPTAIIRKDGNRPVSGSLQKPTIIKARKPAEMSPSKKQALEDALSQIANRKTKAELKKEQMDAPASQEPVIEHIEEQSIDLNNIINITPTDAPKAKSLSGLEESDIRKSIKGLEAAFNSRRLSQSVKETIDG